MGNLCGTPSSITIIIHSRDFEEELCNQKQKIVHAPVHQRPQAHEIEDLDIPRNEFMQVDQI